MEKPISDSQTEAGPNSQMGGDSAYDQGPDRVDAINKLFADFELAYHNQFHKAYAKEDQLLLAKRYWSEALAAYSPSQIVAASSRLVKRSTYLPSLAEVVKACDNGMEVFGLPSSKQAYIEACCASQPKSEYQWSHLAVYLAGKATDWYILASEPEDKVFPLFDYYYQELCRRVMHGEELEAPQARALPERVSRPLSAQENHARMQKLREELDL
ncbi:MAG: replication protein P [Pseudohongiellaceae bacterium]|nr:replication protein P [Pseudohongiellaceae bacterium]